MSLRNCLSVIAIMSLPLLAGCPSKTVSNDTRGAGYQFTYFDDPATARAVAKDKKAGPAIANNNRRCKKDKACAK